MKLAILKVGALAEFSAQDALKYAIITSADKISEHKKKELEVLIGKYLT